MLLQPLQLGRRRQFRYASKRVYTIIYKTISIFEHGIRGLCQTHTQVNSSLAPLPDEFYFTNPIRIVIIHSRGTSVQMSIYLFTALERRVFDIQNRSGLDFASVTTRFSLQSILVPLSPPGIIHLH